MLQETAGRSGRPLVFGRGERRLAFVAVDDVVALVVRAATDPALLGEVLEIGGEPISMEQLALAVQAAQGGRGIRVIFLERPCESRQWLPGRSARRSRARTGSPS